MPSVWHELEAAINSLDNYRQTAAAQKGYQPGCPWQTPVWVPGERGGQELGNDNCWGMQAFLRDSRSRVLLGGFCVVMQIPAQARDALELMGELEPGCVLWWTPLLLLVTC